MLARGACLDLPTWIEHTRDRERNRHDGLDFTPQPPEAVIKPSEDAAAIGGALRLRASLAADRLAVIALLDAIVALLIGKERRQQVGQAGSGLPPRTVGATTAYCIRCRERQPDDIGECQLVV